MAKDLKKQIDEVLEYLISEKSFTVRERAQAILNFLQKLEKQKKITLKPRKDVIQRENKYRGTQKRNAK